MIVSGVGATVGETVGAGTTGSTGFASAVGAAEGIGAGFFFSTFLVQINFDPDLVHTKVELPTLLVVPAFLQIAPTFIGFIFGAASALPIRTDDNEAIIKARRDFERTQELKHYEWSVCKGHIAHYQSDFLLCLRITRKASFQY